MPSSSPTLPDQLAHALTHRTALLEKLAAEDTTAYRLFQGSVEGFPGLTVDRYGDLLLVQSFHQPLSPEQLHEIQGFYGEAIPGLTCIYNDRSQPNSRINNPLPEALIATAHAPHKVKEMGIRYHVRARHAGQDPQLFLDLRAGRRRIMAEAQGKTFLNLFAYTCSAGIAAAMGGASFVVNVDFSETALKAGRENAKLNPLPIRPRFIQSDAFAAMRQLAGIGQAERVRGKRMPAFPKLEPRQFDLVLLDPPPYAKSAFGVVDVIHDYPALFKPALLCTAPGGTLICCNNVASVNRDEWADQLQRSARKAGREIREMEWITPESDFPSNDANAPLKILLLRV